MAPLLVGTIMFGFLKSLFFCNSFLRQHTLLQITVAFLPKAPPAKGECTVKHFY